MNLCQPLKARKPDGILRAYLPGRISTPQQDMEAVAAEQADMEEWLGRAYSGETTITRVGEQASGWVPDRASMLQIERAVRSGECDLVLVREVRELYRNPGLVWKFVYECVDYGVRVICVSNNVDTADENWESAMHFAVLPAGLARPETRRRVRGKATHTFKQGGMVLKVKFGYRKLTKEEAASGTFGPVGLRIARVEEQSAVILEMRRRVLAGASFETVADWLTAEGIDPSPYATSGNWTGRLVADLLTDPILSGRRQFRKELSKLVYRTGKSKAEANPTPLEAEECQGLAYMTPAEHQELLDYLAARNLGYKEAQKSSRDSPLWDVPRSRSLWPGQAVRCVACGELMYQYGKFLKCKSAVSGGARTCWNHVLVPIETLRQLTVPVVTRFLDRDPTARTAIASIAWQEYQRVQSKRLRSGGSLGQIIADLEVQGKNLSLAIAKGGEMTFLLAQLKEVEERLKSVRTEKTRLQSHSDAVGTFHSAADMEAQFEDAVARMAAGSREFADVLRRLIPRFVIQPVQAMDTPLVRPRAMLTLSTTAWAPPGSSLSEEEIAIDLFRAPDHIASVPKCLAEMRASPNSSLRDIALQVGVGYMTVKRAKNYARLMREAGTTDAYRVLNVPPASASRWRPSQHEEGPPPEITG